MGLITIREARKTVKVRERTLRAAIREKGETYANRSV
jgi:phage antirepressor YoqD-like protein